ncbi:hypothetical protein EJD97_023254 [Solanum chilense]|uniref:Uncharacterized protein n=1 Tax=Solanum chilense TaxID=4083 RepID=A0A6N2C3Z3_SOLCI|nr:hypothetical protein EJD97_023254 [Solanum chilense]
MAEEGIANAGAHDNHAPPQDNQLPPLEEVDMGDQVLVVPPLITDGEIREAFLNLTQAMTTEANAFISQVQSMMAQVNLEVVPRMPQYASTMESCLRHITRMKPPMFYS